MTILDVTVNFTLNDPAIWLIAGAVGGLATGQLMKSRGGAILLDLFFGVLGAPPVSNPPQELQYVALRRLAVRQYWQVSIVLCLFPCPRRSPPREGSQGKCPRNAVPAGGASRSTAYADQRAL